MHNTHMYSPNLSCYHQQGRKQATLEVRRPGSNELTVGVPSQAQNCRLVLLDHLTDPPSIFLLIMAHRHALGSTGDGKLEQYV